MESGHYPDESTLNLITGFMCSVCVCVFVHQSVCVCVCFRDVRGWVFSCRAGRTGVKIRRAGRGGGKKCVKGQIISFSFFFLFFPGVTQNYFEKGHQILITSQMCSFAPCRFCQFLRGGAACFSAGQGRAYLVCTAKCVLVRACACDGVCVHMILHRYMCMGVHPLTNCIALLDN